MLMGLLVVMLIVMGRMMIVMLTKRMLLCVNREGGISNKFLDELMLESANKDFEIEHFIPFDVVLIRCPHCRHCR